MFIRLGDFFYSFLQAIHPAIYFWWLILRLFERFSDGVNFFGMGICLAWLCLVAGLLVWVGLVRVRLGGYGPLWSGMVRYGLVWYGRGYGGLNECNGTEMEMEGRESMSIYMPEMSNMCACVNMRR